MLTVAILISVMYLFKSLLKLFLLVILLIVVAFLYFSIWSERREVQSYKQSAPTTGAFLSADDIELFYQEKGPETGQPVVFLHGTGAWSELWRQTLDPLSEKGYRTIAIDTPPFGFSQKALSTDFSTEKQAQRIISVLEELELSHVVIVCHSFGCGAAVEAVMLSPHRIEKIVLVDAAISIDQPIKEPGLLQKALKYKPLRDGLTATLVTNPLMTKLLINQLVYQKQSVTTEVINILQQPLTIQLTTPSVSEWLLYFLSADSPVQANKSESYKNIKQPTLVIWGKEDSITPVSETEKFKAVLPNSKLSIIPKVGHVPYLEDPATFNQALLQFLEE